MPFEYMWIALTGIGLLFLSYETLFSFWIRRSVRVKLKGSNAASGKAGKEKKNIILNLIRPAGSMLTSITPQRLQERLETAVDMSGIKWQMEDVVTFKYLLGALFGVAGLWLQVSRWNLLTRLGFILVFVTAGFLFPDLFLGVKMRMRRKIVQQTIPAFIDYLLIGVEAGLGLDMAIAKVISLLHGPLAEEMANAMTEIKYGKPKREVFKEMSERIEIPEFTSFISALVSAEQYGMSLVNILRVQSQQIKEKRKQAIKEEAYKIPVKLVFPLVFFIFPGLMIVLMGPALIRILEMFAK